MKESKFIKIFLIQVIIISMFFPFLQLFSSKNSSSLGYLTRYIRATLTSKSTPTSNHPNDIITSAAGSHTINWTLYDDEGPGKYRVWANDTNGNYFIWINWRPWSINNPLNIPILRIAAGIFNYTIEYNDSNSEYGVPDTVIVNITNIKPTSNHPNDITTSSILSKTINWTLNDDFGPGQYRVWVNDTNNKDYIWVDWTSWINNISLDIPINDTSLGIFNYTIEYNDSNNLFGDSDTVIVSITEGLPSSNHPDDILTSVGGSETINWILFDDFASGKYCVWVNDTNNNYYVWIDWKPWSINIPLNIPILRSEPGIFNYTIEYNDSSSQFGVPDTVIVNITDSNPYSNHPNNVITTAISNETINWVLKDDFGPGLYRVWANDTNDNDYIWRDWTSWTINIPLNIPINRSAPGDFNYTIEYNDSYGLFGDPDTVMVLIVQGGPTSNHPEDTTTSVNGSETINWTLYDDFGPGKYRVWANDTNGKNYIWVDWTPWANNTALNVAINRTAPGTYNYTISYNDSHSKLGIPDMVIVRITDALPYSNQPNNIPTSANGSETIDWILYDDFGPGQYRILANDTNNKFYVWQSWTPWVNNTALNVAINRTAPGIYNYTIEYYDNYNQFGIPNSVIVNITNAKPTSNQPNDIDTAAGGSATIGWELYDDFGSGQYRVWTNDSNNGYYIWIDWTPWTNNTALNITINRTVPGIYNYTIEYFDAYSLYGFPDTVMVNISDAIPTSNNPSNINTTAGGTETIDWILYDDFGAGKYRVWANDTNNNFYVWSDWTAWINNTVLNIAINRTAPGSYNYTIEFYDIYNLYGIPDSVIINISDANPTSNHPEDILTSTIGTETIGWTLYDDFEPGQYRVWVNDSNDNYYIWIDWITWSNNTSLNSAINHTTAGIYNYTIEYKDSNNLFGNPDTVIVTIIEGLPSSNHPNDITTNASGLETINWTLTDTIGPGKYRILVNDTNDNYYVWVTWSSWLNDTSLDIVINRTAPGIYNYTIEYNNSNSQFGVPDTVIVTITNTLPFSNSPANVITSAKGSETINWTLYDDFGPGNYRIWANNTAGSYYTYIDWSPWINDTELHIVINRTAPGIYNYTIEYYDLYNEYGLPNSVLVNITDSPPTSNQPQDIRTDINGNETIDWILYDDFGSGYYCVWLNDTNGNFYLWKNWTQWINATTLNIPINRTVIGTFNYTIEFNSSTGQMGTDLVIIFITQPSEPPDISSLLLGTIGEGSNFWSSPAGLTTIFGIIAVIIVTTYVISKKSSGINRLDE